LKKVSIITPNENELNKLHTSLGFTEYEGTLVEKVSKVTLDLHTHGIKTIVVTLGDKGCYISEGDSENQTHVLPIEVNAVDAVGAGDCFNGVLASRLSKGDTLRKAVKYANIAASIAVTRRGAQNSMPFWNEIEQKYKSILRI
jgi:ribokinase